MLYQGYKNKFHALQAPLNWDSPVYRLPVELLLEILLISIGRHAGYVEDLNRNYAHDLRRVVELASVSFMWHEVIHSCCKMWSMIDGDMSPQKISLLLAKSKEAELTIRCRELNWVFWELIKPHFHRWRTFVCEEDSRTLVDTWEFFSSHRARCLEVFILRSWVILPSMLFANHAPRLRYVRPWMPSISPCSSLFSSLISLQVTSSQADSYPAQRSEYLTLLKSLSPLLENIEIFRYGYHKAALSMLPLTDSDSLVPQKTFHFPQLRHLGLYGLPCPIVGFLLSSIQPRKIASVVIENMTTAEKMHDPFEVTLFFHSLGISTILSSVSCIYKLTLFHHCAQVFLRGMTNTRYTRDGKHIDYGKQTIKISFNHAVASVAGLYSTLSTSASLGQLTHLELLNRYFFEEPGSIDLFHQLDALEHLLLNSCTRNAQKFLGILTSGSPNSSNRSLLPCRKLRHIGLERVRGYHIQDLVALMTIRYPEHGAGTLDQVVQLEDLEVVGTFSEEEYSLLQGVMGSCTLRAWYTTGRPYALGVHNSEDYATFCGRTRDQE